MGSTGRAIFTGMVCASAVLAPAGLARAAVTIHVTTTADVTANDGACSLREAVTAASSHAPSGAAAGECPAGDASGTTIDLPSGTYTLTQNAQLTVGGTTTIAGAGSTVTKIAATGQSRVVLVPGGATATIRGVEVTGGKDAYGGGILNQGTLQLADALVDGNATNDGIAAGPGGNGTAGGDGGGIFNSGTLALQDTDVMGNTTGSGGTGISSEGAGGDGGGIVSIGTLTVDGGRISGNSTGSAGSGTLPIRGGDGGGLLVAGTATITGATIGSNHTGSGSGTPAIAGYGAGIDAAAHVGQGFAELQALTIRDTTVEGNVNGPGADDLPFAAGVNVFPSAPSTVAIDRSAIVGNRGAGVSVFATSASGSFVMRNSTVGEQTADGIAVGEDIDSQLTADVRFTTIAHNVGPAIRNGTRRGMPFTVDDSILDSNGACDGTAPITGQHDIAFASSGCPGDDVDPWLSGLADHGGPTPTYALASESPAIDVLPSSDADCAGDATDQRGVARPAGAGCDLGAYERVPPAAGGSTGATTPPPPSGGPQGPSAPAAPKLSKLKVSPSRVSPGRRPAIAYTDSLAATTTLTIKRIGRGGKLVTIGAFRHRDRRGRNAMRIPAKLAKRLRRGRYEVVAVASLAGARSAAISKRFTVARAAP